MVNRAFLVELALQQAALYVVWRVSSDTVSDVRTVAGHLQCGQWMRRDSRRTWRCRWGNGVALVITSGTPVRPALATAIAGAVAVHAHLAQRANGLQVLAAYQHKAAGPHQRINLANRHPLLT